MGDDDFGMDDSFDWVAATAQFRSAPPATAALATVSNLVPSAGVSRQIPAFPCPSVRTTRDARCLAIAQMAAAFSTVQWTGVP